MDPVSQWLSDPTHKIPIGVWGKAVSDWLTTTFESLFDAIAYSLNFILDGLVDLLNQVPPVIVCLAIAALAWWLQRSRSLALGVLVGMLFILNQGLWKQTVETLVLVVAAAAASMAIGVPIGIWCAHKPKVYRVLLPILDLMQTLPTFVYLIPVLTLFGLGNAPGLSVTLIFVIP